MISGLSSHAGIVVAPKYQNNIKHIEFIRLNNTQVMSIIASTTGQIENRIIATISAHLPTNFKPWWEDTGSFARDFLLDDGVHLSAKGHSLLAKAITNNIISKNS